MSTPDFFLPQAHWQSAATPTGRLRLLRPSRTVAAQPRLQAEWMVRWGNNAGEGVERQWHDITTVIDDEAWGRQQ